MEPTDLFANETIVRTARELPLQESRGLTVFASVILGGACIALIRKWFARTSSSNLKSNHNQTIRRNNTCDEPPLPSLLLPCITNHRRYLPVPAKHGFSYPLIYLGLDLDQLESNSIDLSSRFFRYGSALAVLGIKHEQYLAPSDGPKSGVPGAWRGELEDLVEQHGVDPQDMGRIWLVTMPSYLGFVGVNPLSVYFCYRKGGQEAGLLCVVLEVHNTFEERHLYVLRVDHEEVDTQGNHDHAWIFPRTFHVSPFNNRAGFYRLDIQDPFKNGAETPRIMVTLNQLTAEKERKLYAALLNHPDKKRKPVVIVESNILRTVLWRQPWDLFLTTFRILRQAWTLHYEKRLLVYPRPELHTRTQQSETIGSAEEGAGHGLKLPWNPVQIDLGGIGRSIGHRAVDAAERKAQGLLLPDLKRRAQEEGINVEIQFSDPSRLPLRFGPDHNGTTHLDIHTRHPSLFIQLLMARTPEQFWMTACQEGHTYLSSRDAFEKLMTPHQKAQAPGNWLVEILRRWTETVRTNHLFFLLSFCELPVPPSIVAGAASHIARPTSIRHNFSILSILLSVLFADKIEEKIFRLVKAKFFPGQEPWTVWQRAVETYWQADKRDIINPVDPLTESDRTFGSVLLAI